jgi:hypothetical protein
MWERKEEEMLINIEPLLSRRGEMIMGLAKYCLKSNPEVRGMTAVYTDSRRGSAPGGSLLGMETHSLRQEIASQGR